MALSDDNVLFSALQDLQGAFLRDSINYFRRVIYMTNNVIQNQTSGKKVELIRVDRLYESLRYNEYSPENGMGEIVDNSVEAGATRIDVKITRDKQQGKGRPKTKIDEIAVIDNGRMVEIGNHEQLIKLNGRYAELYNLQFKNSTIE
jgi:hypothetical protein